MRKLSLGILAHADAGYPVPWDEVKDHMHLPPAVQG